MNHRESQGTRLPDIPETICAETGQLSKASDLFPFLFVDLVPRAFLDLSLQLCNQWLQLLDSDKTGFLEMTIHFSAVPQTLFFRFLVSDV